MEDARRRFMVVLLLASRNFFAPPGTVSLQRRMKQVMGLPSVGGPSVVRMARVRKRGGRPMKPGNGGRAAMTELVWVWKEIGVKDVPWRRESTIPVPLAPPGGAGFSGQTLIMLRDTKGQVQFDTSIVDVTEVKPQDVGARLERYLDDIDVSGDARKDLLDSMRTHVLAEAQTGRSKLLAVKGKMPGQKTTLQIGREARNVEVIPAASYTVSFRFLQRCDACDDVDRSKDPVHLPTWTARNPAEVNGWISQLNWIFGSQANITFELGTAQWFGKDTPIAPPDEKIGREVLAPQRDNDASFTVFVVGYVHSSGRAGAWTIPPERFGADRAGTWVTIMPDHPQAPNVKSDPFILTLAHELSHAIQRDRLPGGMHFCETGILRSATLQTTKIGDLLRPLLVKRGGMPPDHSLCEQS
jgi:hypothetical protein